MRSLISVILLVGMLAAVAVGQPTTQPGQGSAPFGRRGGRGQFLTPQEMAQAQNWAKEHMPNLAKLMEDAPRGLRKQNLGRIITVRMHEFDQATDSVIKDRMLKTFAAEDTIAHYLGELAKAEPANRAAIRQKMHATMRDLVQGFLSERADRLEKLKARLDEEQKQLDQDRSNLDLLVERRLGPFLATNPLLPQETTATEPANASVQQGEGK